MEAPQLRQSKDVERLRSPAQTSSRGTPRFKRPVQHTPSPTKLQYGDAFLITTVDGQHCLCPNLFDASIYLIPMRFVKESGFFPLCCFTFDRMQKPGGGLLQDSAASDGATSPYVFAGEDLNIRHRASGQFIRFDDLNSPHQEPAHSCASMTNLKCSDSRLRLQYRVTVDAEARFMLSHTEISIFAHGGNQSYLCPARRASQDWCIEAIFASDRQASWVIEPLSTADAEAMACSSSRPAGIRFGSSGRIKNIQGLTLSYHPTALFPVFIPLDSVTSDGSWTDPNSVWSLWTLEDPVDCFNMGYSTASVQLRHLITARLIRMGGPCRSSSSDSSIQAASVNMIGIAEGRGSQFSVYHIDQNRFMLSHGGGDSEPRAVQSTPMDLAVLDCLPLDDHLFASARASISLSTVAPGCSRLHLLSACPFRSENSIFMWSPEHDRVQHLIYEISSLIISANHARAQLLSEMGASLHAVDPPPDAAGPMSHAAGITDELEMSMRDGVEAVKNVGAFFSSNISSLGEKVMSVGSTSSNQGPAPNITESNSPSKGNFPQPKTTRGNTETECLTSLCNLASTLLDPLTEVIRRTLGTLQSQGMEAVQVLQSLDALPIFGELAFLFSSYLVHMLSSIRIGDQQISQPDKPLLNRCIFVGSSFSGPLPSFYQHVAAFRSCIKSHYHGPSAQQVLCEILGGSVDGWRGLESLLYLSPSFRAFTTCVGEMARLSAHALPTYQCNENLFTCVITAVPYYIHCDQTLMTLLKHELVRAKYGEMVLEIAFQRLIKFFKKNVFFSEVHLLRQKSSKGSAQQEFWVSEGSYWIGVLNFLAEQPLMEGMVFRRHIFSRLCLAVREGGAVPAFKSMNGGSALLVCRPSVALESSLDEQTTKPQNATARWVTSGGLRSVGRGIDASTGWTDLMSCDVQKASATSLSVTGSSIPPHEVVLLVSATMTLYHNLVFHEDHKKCSPHVWSDVLQFICRQCPADFVLGCLSNPLFSYDIRCAACKLTRRLAFQCSRRRFSMPIFSWSSERIVPTLDVECNRTTFYQWIDDFKLLTSILNNLLECFKPEEESRRPPPVVAIAILELTCEAIANNLWSDLASIKQLYAIFSDIFLRPLAPDQNRERSLALNVINRYLPFLQGDYIKSIRDGFKFIAVGPGEVVCSGRGLDSDPCIVICQFGELSLCYDDLGNGAVCIATVSNGDIMGLEILNFIATNWFDEDGLSAAPLKQQKCIATRPSKLWVITRSALLSAILARSRVSDVLDPVSSIEVDARCLASSAMSLCLEVEQKKFCLEAVRQMRLHINLAPGIYLHPSRPFKQQRVSETLSLVLGTTSASVVEGLFRASGGRLLINDTQIFGFPIKIAACYIFAIHMIISLGLTTLKVLNRLGEVEDVTVGTNDSPSHEFLAVMFVAWFLCSSFGLYSVSMRKPRLIQWALIGHCFAVSVTILSLVASSYSELEKLPYATILSKLASAMLAVFFEAFLFLIVLTYFALLSKKEASRASVELSEKNLELVDNLLVDQFSTNQLFASSSKTIFSQIASNDPRLSEAASHFFVNSCQNKAKLFAALESCVLLRTPQSEMVFQALVGACSELYKNSTHLIETVLSLSHPLSFTGNRRSWPPVIIDASVLSQSGNLISILVDLKIKVSTISDTLRKEAAKYDDRSGGMSPSEWRRIAYASQLDKSLCMIVGVAQSISSHVSSFGSLQCSSDQGNALVSICLDLMSWCCVEDTRWQEIVAELLCEVGPTIIFISPFQAAAAIAECCRNNMKVRTMHGRTMVSLLCSAFDDKNVKLLQSNQIEALIRALRVVVAGSIVSATLPVEGVGELVVQHVLPFASKVLEDLGYVKCRFIECDDKDLQDAVEITSDSVSDRQLVPCGRCGGTGVQQLFKCCFCDGRRYVSVSLSQAPANNFFDEHELSVAPLAADSAPKVQIYGARPVKGSEWWARFGDKCCLETLYLLAVTCELGNHFMSSQVRGLVSFDSVGKAACDPVASKEMRASLVRFCASVHIPAAVANNLDRRWANPVHPAWMITDALSRFVQDNPVSRLCDIVHEPNSASFLLLSIWTPVIELLCKRVLTLNTRAMCNPIREILRRFADSICISGYSSMNIAACQNAITCLTVLRALDITPQLSMYQAFDKYVTQEVFAQHALASTQKTIDLSASTSDISALRWKSYITAIKPVAEHIEMIIANELIQAEPGIHLSTSVASAIAFNLCSSCCKGGYFFDQHGAWNDVVRGITQAIEPCASKLLKTSSIFSIKWIAEGVCNVVGDSISMAALPSPHRFAHASGGLYLGIRFLSSFKRQGQELLVNAVLSRPDDSFFTGLIAIIDEAALTAPRVAACYNQVVQTLKREQSSYEAMPTLDKGTKPKSRSPTSIEEAKVWERLDELVTESSSCTLSKRLAFGGLASKFLQCWCEDHNAFVQDACAGQRPHGTSNPILSLASLVLVCSRQGCPPLQIITSLAIEAISESIQRPCKPQQVAIAQTDIVHACDDLILGRWSDGCDPSIVFGCNCPLAVPDSLRSVLQTSYSLPDIRHKACNLLLALVESLDMDSGAAETSTPLLILKAMRLEEHKKALSQLDRSNQQDLSTCASVVVVLLTLQPFVPKYGLWAAKALCIKSILNPDTNSDIPIMSLVRNRIRCVDIVHRGAINRVWFSQPDVMDFRRSHYLESIQRSIFDPSDRNAQFAAFVLLSLALIEQMLLDQRLSRNVFTKFLTRAIGWIQYLFNINALLINAIMLFAFEHPDQDKPSSMEGELFFNLSPDIVFRNEQYIFALRSLSAIQFTLSFCMFYWFMISDVSFIVRERIRQNPAWMKIFVDKRGGPEHFVIWCRSVVSNPRFLALSSYFITSILAVTLPDKFTPMLFLSFHLADVIYTSKDMKIVFDFIASVWANLVTIIGFIFILLNIFGAVGFVWIPDWFELPEVNSDWYPAVNGTISSGAAVEAPCTTLWRCFLIQVDKGLVLGDIDFGIVSTPTSDVPASMMYSRIFYSFVFQVVVVILFSFILYTVVIDSFSKFRINHDELAHQISNRCLICSLGRDELVSLHSDSFEDHIESVHGLFDYIAFIAMIILKDHSTLSGPEYAVFNCIVDVTPSGVMPKAKPDTTWLPYRVHFPSSPRCVFVHRHVQCQAVASQTATASASGATPPLQVFFSGMFCCVLCLIQQQEALRTAVHSTQKWMKGIIAKTR